jgi:DNA-binding NtrC family response regulator
MSGGHCKLKMGIFNRIKNMKILLVDDDEWIRDSLSLFFEAEGCNLLTFETAEEGMEALKQQSYDIVISDYKLPGMDGLEFLRRVKEKQPKAFEVLITAYANCEILKEAKEIGVEDIIPKPFTSEDVETSLARIIENSA